MDDQGLGAGPIRDIEPIGGGTQNVMLEFVRGKRRFVFRRGPRHVRAATNPALRREMRVLSGLAVTPVPHPRLIASCSDESVLGDSVFYLMEPVEGFNAATTLPPPYAADSSLRHGMGLAAVDALAVLGSVDFEAVGLSDFGRPEGFLERQVARWMGELESYSELDGYGGPDVPGVSQVADWLERNRPTVWQPGIMHGDYHIANVMFRHDRAEVSAIVDWEMCTIGDPLLDLGWLLSMWPLRGDETALIGGPAAQMGGLATSVELVERYAGQSPRDLSSLPWYVVLACFKLGIVLEGTYARACAGQASRSVGEQLHATTLHLFDRARGLAAGSVGL
ncbi:phosphotransferase family protein [Nocardia sp. NPDC055029]